MTLRWCASRPTSKHWGREWPYFNLDTVEYASRERDESKPGIKTLLPFLKKKQNITKESDLEVLEDLIVALVHVSVNSTTSQMLAICFIRQSQYVHRDSETIEGAILADFRRQCPSSRKILCTVWCYVYMYIFISE